MRRAIVFSDKKSNTSDFVLVADGLKGLYKYLDYLKKNPSKFPFEGLIKKDMVQPDDIDKIWYVHIYE